MQITFILPMKEDIVKHFTRLAQSKITVKERKLVIGVLKSRHSGKFHKIH